MPIRFNTDTDPDYLLMQHQGRAVPVPTRLAVDDGENISGGVQPGGGTAGAGSAASASLAAQQNFSQIQENPFPCILHGTEVTVWNSDGGWGLMFVQDLIPGHRLKLSERSNKIVRIDRVWQAGLWTIAVHDFTLTCSPQHRVITSYDDGDGTPVNTLKGGDLVLCDLGNALAQMVVRYSHAVDDAGWVYRISLDGIDMEAHWFVSNGVCSHNVKNRDEL